MTTVKLSIEDRNLLRKAVSCSTKAIQALVEGTVVTNMQTGVIVPTLPYTIANNEFQSYSITTTGVVALNGEAVPEGVYSWSAPDSGKLSSINISGSGSVIITTQKQV